MTLGVACAVFPLQFQAFTQYYICNNIYIIYISRNGIVLIYLVIYIHPLLSHPQLLQYHTSQQSPYVKRCFGSKYDAAMDPPRTPTPPRRLTAASAYTGGRYCNVPATALTATVQCDCYASLSRTIIIIVIIMMIIMWLMISSSSIDPPCLRRGDTRHAMARLPSDRTMACPTRGKVDIVVSSNRRWIDQ
jgi:hypothetical protein